MISFIRIDSRLIHGQVIEGWLPHLKIQRIVVADDATVSDPLARAAMSLAVPPDVDVLVSRIDDVPYRKLQNDGPRTLVLLRDVDAAVRAYARGLSGPLNLGNVHAGPERLAVSRSVFLTDAEKQQLLDLSRDGLAVSIQAVPNEPAQALR
ncbi:MAG: PTS sugar transporter subunit IIB [Myxococcaceae bacterium]|nr:PTS sugar transporter subunit IIB [Myxococcaceae bacterium]